MQPESAAHLWDAANAAGLVAEFVSGKSQEQFNQDVLVRSAVERQLEILGEALNRLRRDDPATAERVPDVRRIIGMRNILAHEYGAIDYEIVWAVANTRIPILRGTITVLLSEQADDSGKV